MSLQKVDGAPDNPNGMRLKQYSPRLVQKAERCLARSDMPSCQYPLRRSNVANVEPLEGYRERPVCQELETRLGEIRR